MNEKPKPERIPVDFSAIPEELEWLADEEDVQRPNWVLWNWTYDKKKGKWDKPPLQRSGKFASSTNSTTWCTLQEAMHAYNTGKFDGIGFVLEPPWVGIDLDDCRDPKTGEIRDWARSIVSTVNSYTEVSPSGRGLKIFCRGTIASDHAEKGIP